MQQPGRWWIGLIALLVLWPLANLAAAEPLPRAEAKDAGTEPPLARPFEWQAARSADTLDLSGVAPSSEARDAIRAKAGALFPKLKIVDTTSVARGAPSGDFTALAVHVLETLAKLDGGGATIRDDQVTVSGTARNGADIPAMEKELRATLPKPFHLVLLRLQPPASP